MSQWFRRIKRHWWRGLSRGWGHYRGCNRQAVLCNRLHRCLIRRLDLGLLRWGIPYQKDVALYFLDLLLTL